jgi:hypothetical protein
MKKCFLCSELDTRFGDCQYHKNKKNAGYRDEEKRNKNITVILVTEGNLLRLGYKLPLFAETVILENFFIIAVRWFVWVLKKLHNYL